eukprot:s798_g1.t1
MTNARRAPIRLLPVVNLEADIVPRELLKAAVAKKREEVSAAKEAAKEGDSPQHQ